MGYAMPEQTGRGLHYRLWSRAFAIEDAAGNRVVYVSVDLCMTMMGVKVGVVNALQARYGDLYTHQNVLISGIHTHSGPAAYSWFLLYDITTGGFNEKHYNTIVDGIVASIVAAHDSLEKATPGTIAIAQGLVENSNINRSPGAYLANPESERAMYEQWGGDVDKNMTVLRFEDESGTEIGAAAIFAVHCTSMHNTNHLVSGDNKGRASMLFEQAKNPAGTLPGDVTFVAAFGQSNEGDVSPNTLGAWCYAKVNGTDCRFGHSVCDGKNEQCLGVGPGGFDDDFHSTDVIGTQQYEAAAALYDSAKTLLSGNVSSVHMWLDIANTTVSPEYTGLDEDVTTCRPAVGMSFAAGTTDGPGAFNFQQADNKSSNTPLWNIVRDFIKDPTPEQIKCQYPKPIFVDVGEIEPHPWVPTVVPIQLVKIGQLVLAAVPGEFTTMSGRRLRNTIAGVFADHGEDVTVVVAGLSNTYTQYIATPEEYTIQRYEGASTLYGPNTLPAYQQNFAVLAEALALGKTVDPGPVPLNESFVNFDLQPGVLFDTHPIGKTWGEVESDANCTSAGCTAGETVSVTFWGANLRNNYMTGSTYLTVELESDDGDAWTVVANDASWETRLHWKRKGLSESLVTVDWTIPEGTPAGTYRIQHFGYFKKLSVSTDIEPYSGTSSSFKVAA